MIKQTINNPPLLPTEVTITHITASKLIDVLEIGTPGKEGSIKVHVDADDLESSKQRIDNMIELRTYLKSKL